MNKAAKMLLIVGLIGALLTVLSDLMLGFVRVPINGDLISQFISGAIYLPTVRIGYGAVLGSFGILMQCLGFFAIYILMIEKAEVVAIFNRISIFGYGIFFGIIHLGYATTLYIYKTIFEIQPENAMKIVKEYISYFLEPLAIFAILFAIILVLTQFLAILQKKTIIPNHVAIYGNAAVGLIIAIVVASLLPKYLELWNGITTSCFSIANVWMFLITFLSIMFKGRDNEKSKTKKAAKQELLEE